MARSLLLLVVLATAAPADEPDAARRDALARYGAGLLKARNDLPVQAIKQFEAAAKADAASPAPHRELVKLYADLGRDAAAIRAARKALALDPADADTAHALGKLLFDGKKFADAAAVLKQAADSPRADPVKRFGVLRDLARARESAGDWAGAEDALRTALAVASDHRAALLKSPAYPTPIDLDKAAAAVRERVGQALVEQRKFTDATGAFQEAARQFTAAGDQEAAARLGWNLSGALAAEGKVDDALDQLEGFLKLKPSGAAPYERYAALLRRAGRGRDVFGVLSRMVSVNPTNTAICWVAAAERMKDDPADAYRLFLETANRTADPELFRAWVQALKTAGRLDQILTTADRLYAVARPEQDDNDRTAKPPADPQATARAQGFTAAVRAEPGLSGPLIRRAADEVGRNTRHHDDTWALVAGLAERDGLVSVAERALTTALHNGNTSVFPHLYRLLFAQRKWTEALNAIDAAAAGGRRGPGQPNRLYDYYKALPLAELGRTGEALAAVDRATPIANDRLGLRVHRVRVLNVLDRHAQAAAEGAKVLAECHNPVEARQVRFVLSEAYLGLNDHARAEAELRTVLEDDPDDVLALNNLSYNLADQGRNLAEAEEMIRRAIELDRDESLKAGSPEGEKGTYLDSLGWVLFRRGRLAEARELLGKAAASPDAAADPIVWDHLGDVCFRLGDKAKAREAWGRAAEQYEGSHQGRQHGRLDEVKRKLKQAE